MRIHNLNQPDLFHPESDRLEEAYNRQGEKIAFTGPEFTQNENNENRVYG